MKIFKIFTICTILLSAIFINSCNVPASDYKYFESRLRGTWVSEGTSIYTGTLVIDNDRITITGYYGTQTPKDGDDNKRPFKDFPKGTALKGYSEEGKIFIEYGGGQNGIPYTYNETGTFPLYDKILEFTFGGEKQFLKWTE